MAVLWAICGAGRGVGKTHLALALCGALPDAVYVKLGGGPHNPNKPQNLVRAESDLQTFIAAHSHLSHIVAEANALAARGKADITIYIDAADRRDDLRTDRDVLRRAAHIVVSPGCDTRRWKDVLKSKLNDSQLVERVFDILADQQRFVARGPVGVRTKVWLVSGGQRVFGSGLAALLAGIDRLGSLSQAARTAGISYRKAWNLIKEAETALGRRLVETRAGGVRGGGSVLSSGGRRLLEVFNALSQDVAAYADSRFAALVDDRCAEPISEADNIGSGN